MTQLQEKMDIEQFNKIAFHKRTKCVICDQKFAEPVIDLPQFPLTEIYVQEKITKKIGLVDQSFHLCPNCGHGQLANIIDKNILYGHCYRTRTSISPSAMGAVNVFAQFIENILGDRSIKMLLEIGCNDLYFLYKLKDRAETLYGIDPILKEEGKIFSDEKIKLIGDFFENVNLKEAGIKPDVVLSSHTFEHIDRPAELIEKLLNHASPDALFFFQFPGLESLVRDARFDQLYHQHLNYFSVKSVCFLLEKLGAEVIDLQVNPYHWGALMVAFCKKKGKAVSFNQDGVYPISEGLIKEKYQIFKDCMNVTASRIAAHSNEPMYGFGAAMMLPVLDYYIKNLRQLKYILDDDAGKKDLYYLNFPVQIKSPQEIKNIKDSVIVLTAIYSLTTQRAILKRLVDLKVKQIILPINII